MRSRYLTDIVAEEEDTITKLYRRYRAALYRHCLARLKDPELAEDAVQETYLSAYANRHKIRTENLWCWLSTIATRRCIDIHRRRSRLFFTDYSEESTFSRLPEVPDIADEVVAGEWRLDLERALRSLPPRQRRAVLLYALEDWAYADIASAEQVSVQAVKSLMGRARKLLRKTCERPVFGIAPLVQAVRLRARLAMLRVRSAQPLFQNAWWGAVESVSAVAVAIALALTLPPGPVDSAFQKQAVVSAAPDHPIVAAEVPSVSAMEPSPATSSGEAPASTYQGWDPNATLSELGKDIFGSQEEETPENTSIWTMSEASGDSGQQTAFAVGLCRGALGNCRVLFGTNDGGATWTRLGSRSFLGDMVVAAPGYPADPRVFSLGWEGLQVSRDKGENFETAVPTLWNRSLAVSSNDHGDDTQVLVGGWSLIEYWPDQNLVRPSSLMTVRPSTSGYTGVAFSPQYPRHPVILFARQPTYFERQGSQGFSHFVNRCEGLVCEELVPPLIGEPWWRLSPNFADDGQAFEFTSEGIAFYSDKTKSFQRLPLKVWHIWDLAVDWRKDGPPHLFVAVSNSSAGGFYRSLDGGATWERRAVPGLGGLKNIVSFGEGHLIVSADGRGVACSSDYGESWAKRCTTGL